MMDRFRNQQQQQTSSDEIRHRYEAEMNNQGGMDRNNTHDGPEEKHNLNPAIETPRQLQFPRQSIRSSRQSNIMDSVPSLPPPTTRIHHNHFPNGTVGSHHQHQTHRFRAMDNHGFPEGDELKMGQDNLGKRRFSTEIPEILSHTTKKSRSEVFRPTDGQTIKIEPGTRTMSERQIERGCQVDKTTIPATVNGNQHSKADQQPGIRVNVHVPMSRSPVIGTNNPSSSVRPKQTKSRSTEQIKVSPQEVVIEKQPISVRKRRIQPSCFFDEAVHLNEVVKVTCKKNTFLYVVQAS